ncbi:hybrid sensor histidine kinase/response regulator (plasmid) [Buttiauxella sp. 3AFRM03]|uniref:hybrid sensor histidine kinase/response regulator n=1 Tax=Buttiauxella sp. 3AFRM03 TaxID=2479367 RepID=UPI000EF7620D|nr:hybrid sensor histidine kinase/response regulator [Buttiauxella sp. 3AFRM03]AYN25678.1 hybrid sensor histidine kinase/response regulator [Buttiauxella sp. 3AFRM03]
MKRGYYLSLVGMFFVLIVSLVTIFKYNSILSEKSLYAIAGTQENYAWSIAKFSIQLNEFYAMINNETDIDTIRLKLDILHSRVNIIRRESESTKPLYKQAGYKENIDAIYNRLSNIHDELNKPSPDIKKIVFETHEIRPLAITLTNLADHAEVAQRTDALIDFMEKRKQLWLLLFITASLLIILCVIIIIYIKKTNKLLFSERTAIANKNAFLGVVVHELRTSLQAIISAIDVITNSNNKMVEKNQLQRLETAAGKMERQMKDLAEFAKIDNGYIDINKSFFKIKPVIENIVLDCMAIYSKKGVEVTVSDIKDIVVYTDSVRLNQVVENLTSNALKYTQRGKVHIDCDVIRDKWLCISIFDTGQGIPKDKLKFIFKPFVRLSNDRSNMPGFGMGLAIVNGLIKALKGSIHIESVLGEGTSITIKIPVEIGTEDLLTSSELNNYLSTEEISKIHVLVVDDNDMACSSITHLLESYGYVVESTTSPERALQKLLRKPFDLILSDLQMPVLTGDELFTALRSQASPNSSTPFIFVSAFADLSPVPEVPLLTKPVRISEINATIHKLISTKNSDLDNKIV